jgi:hypothetical protein
MQHIFIDKSKSDSDTLAIFIKDLDFPEKQYQEIQIKLDGEDNNWLNIPIEDTDNSYSQILIIDNLEIYKRYKIHARLKINNGWYYLEPCTFVTQENNNINYTFNELDYVVKTQMVTSKKQPIPLKIGTMKK